MYLLASLDVLSLLKYPWELRILFYFYFLTERVLLKRVWEIQELTIRLDNKQ